jgi:hypothetical protein
MENRDPRAENDVDPIGDNEEITGSSDEDFEDDDMDDDDDLDSVEGNDEQ